jgi:hypothetical protein
MDSFHGIFPNRLSFSHGLSVSRSSGDIGGDAANWWRKYRENRL